MAPDYLSNFCDTQKHSLLSLIIEICSIVKPWSFVSNAACALHIIPETKLCNSKCFFVQI